MVEEYDVDYGKWNSYKSVSDPNNIGDYSWCLTDLDSEKKEAKIEVPRINGRNYNGFFDALSLFGKPFSQEFYENFGRFRKKLGFSFLNLPKVKSLDFMVQTLKSFDKTPRFDFYYEFLLNDISGLNINYGKNSLVIDRFRDKKGREKVRIKKKK